MADVLFLISVDDVYHGGHILDLILFGGTGLRIIEFDGDQFIIKLSHMA